LLSRTQFGTPLWSTGHLHLKAGDYAASRFAPISNVAMEAERVTPPISALEGEMAGRPEGGENEDELHIIGQFAAP